MSYQPVRFFGHAKPNSGYGNATMAIARAFSDSSIPTKYIINNEEFKSSLNNYDGNTEIDFYLQTPPFSKHKTSSYRIGYFYWEADVLPKLWAKDIQTSVDEIWVPCQLTKSAVLKAGFRGRVEVVFTPYVNNLECNDIKVLSNISPSLVLSDDIFKFYSIFQWNERKGYNELLTSYYNEFSSNDNVILILKVNEVKHKGHGLERIKNDILKIKSRTNKKNMPKVCLITQHLSREDLNGLHSICDAFVLPHHGEGWGMPIHDAMLHGKNIITTKYGGITEYLNDDSAFLVDFNLGEVNRIDWNPWYEKGQKWAYPRISSIMSNMRYLYENGSTKGLVAKDIAERFSINNLMVKLHALLEQRRVRK
jgi:glycosyltransferase involved in cell wall biosynthesis